MKKCRPFQVCTLLFLLASPYALGQNFQDISREELRDKIHGYWIGQLAGNYVGFPFENLYEEEPIPIRIDRYYTFQDAEKLGLKMNLQDRRAYIHIMADALGGAWSDDDTDIEFVTLHAVETHGLDLDYEQLASMWKKHINRFIWGSARRARDLMEEGLLPPETGSRERNEHWYRISSQLMGEIWGAFYPGMTEEAARRSAWAAKVMTDDWATHPDIAYGVMYSAAFFESDVGKLVRLAVAKLPSDSPYRRGMEDVLAWRAQYGDWRETRAKLHEKYYRSVDGFEIPYPVASSVINGLCGIMAILYGEGDFVETVGIATAAGYDCDNQAATAGGLIGILNGGKSIPDTLTRDMPSRGRWSKPFNDQYINYSRDGLPNHNKISDIVYRILAITEQAILQNGGSRYSEGGETRFRVATDLP